MKARLKTKGTVNEKSSYFGGSCRELLHLSCILQIPEELSTLAIKISTFPIVLSYLSITSQPNFMLELSPIFNCLVDLANH